MKRELSDEDAATFDARVAYRTVWALLEENGRLRAALEWYAGADAHDDGGWRAQQALSRKDKPAHGEKP